MDPMVKEVLLYGSNLDIIMVGIFEEEPIYHMYTLFTCSRLCAEWILVGGKYTLKITSMHSV
jgi:hypothetical protein